MSQTPAAFSFKSFLRRTQQPPSDEHNEHTSSPLNTAEKHHRPFQSSHQKPTSDNNYRVNQVPTSFDIEQPSGNSLTFNQPTRNDSQKQQRYVQYCG